MSERHFFFGGARLCRAWGPACATPRLDGVSPYRLAAKSLIAAFISLLLTSEGLAAAPEQVNPEIGAMLERAVLDAEAFRKAAPHLQYEAKMQVQEWDGRGGLRGTAKADAIMRPGDPRPITFLSREVHGKVRLPDDKESAKEDDEKEMTLQEFARQHQITSRFEFADGGTEQVAGKPARRISFVPKPDQPEKDRADRFLDSITGAIWVSEGENKLVKFDLRLRKPLQLLWIFAVLKELSIQYELIEPDEILGHAKMKVLFALSTPVYSIRQLHDVDLDHFRKREITSAAK